jgi:hypothetical protein
MRYIIRFLSELSIHQSGIQDACHEQTRRWSPLRIRNRIENMSPFICSPSFRNQSCFLALFAILVRRAKGRSHNFVFRIRVADSIQYTVRFIIELQMRIIIIFLMCLVVSHYSSFTCLSWYTMDGTPPLNFAFGLNDVDRMRFKMELETIDTEGSLFRI